jgi:hypothetical protein
VTSVTAQRVLMWWLLVFAGLTGIAFVVLLGVVPPPSSTLSADQLASWYTQHLGRVKAGAMLLGWVSAFTIQLAVVLWAQARRVEPNDSKIWSTTILVSCSIVSIFLAFPGLAFGAAAYNAERAPEITQVMHQLAVLTMVTTDQLYLPAWVGIVVICFISKDGPSNPFPRWWGWVTAWSIIVIEPGALAFLPKTGLFAVNGVVAFWLPAIAFGGWIFGQLSMIFRALKVQEEEKRAAPDAADDSDLSAGRDGAATV